MQTWPIALLASLAAAPAGAAQTYRIQPERSSLIVRTYRGGFASALGHDHAIRATDAAGEIVFDPARPADDSVRVTVHVTALAVDEPQTRAEMGLGPGPSDADRLKITDQMRSVSQLDAARFPAISFRSTRCEALPDGNLRITGELTLHGVTRGEVLIARISAAGPELVGDGNLTFNQTDFGIRPFSGGPFGAVKNQDQVTMRIHLVGAR